MPDHRRALRRNERTIARAFVQAILETLWPTRCALCDTPGQLLCDACRLRLPYIDQVRCCPRCGAPFGTVQCTECNDVMLASLGRKMLPFDGCTSVTMMTKATGRIVSLYKDRGERALAQTIAGLVAPCISATWKNDARCLTWIPATNEALRRRGFDHGQLVAEHLAAMIGVPARPRRKA